MKPFSKYAHALKSPRKIKNNRDHKVEALCFSAITLSSSSTIAAIYKELEIELLPNRT